MAARLLTSTPVELAQHLKLFLDHAGSSITGAWISGSAPSLRVTVRRSFRDLSGASTRRTLQSFQFDVHSGTWSSGGPPVPLGASVLHVAPSPSGARLALLRTAEDAAPAAAAAPSAKARIVCELWDVACGALVREVVSDGLHGAPLADGWFSEGLSWSPCERFTAYVAEGLQAAPAGSDKDTFFTALTPAALAKKAQAPAVATAAAEEDPILGALGSGRNASWEAGAREDWGEKYVGVRAPRPFVIDWASGLVHGLGADVPSSLSLGQPVFAPALAADAAAGSPLPTLVMTGWAAGSRRLGLIHCFNRACALYALPLSSLLAPRSSPARLHCITPTFPIARSPRVSPDGRLLACLTMQDPVCLQTHNGPSTLTLYDFAEVGAWVRRECEGAVEGGAGAGGARVHDPPPPLLPPCPLPSQQTHPMRPLAMPSLASMQPPCPLTPGTLLDPLLPPVTARPSPTSSQSPLPTTPARWCCVPASPYPQALLQQLSPMTAMQRMGRRAQAGA